jgi:hypothetical protein
MVSNANIRALQILPEKVKNEGKKKNFQFLEDI